MKNTHIGRRQLLLVVFAILGTIGMARVIAVATRGQIHWDSNAPFLVLAIGLWRWPNFWRKVATIYLSLLSLAGFALLVGFGQTLLGSYEGTGSVVLLLLYLSALGLAYTELTPQTVSSPETQSRTIR